MTQTLWGKVQGVGSGSGVFFHVYSLRFLFVEILNFLLFFMEFKNLKKKNNLTNKKTTFQQSESFFLINLSWKIKWVDFISKIKISVFGSFEKKKNRSFCKFKKSPVFLPVPRQIKFPLNFGTILIKLISKIVKDHSTSQQCINSTMSAKNSRRCWSAKAIWMTPRPIRAWPSQKKRFLENSLEFRSTFHRRRLWLMLLKTSLEQEPSEFCT